MISANLFPYSADSPKRLVLQHVARYSYRAEENRDSLVPATPSNGPGGFLIPTREDSYLWIYGMDYRKLRDIPDFDDLIPSSKDLGPVCPDKAGYCPHPWFLPLQSLLKGAREIPVANSESHPTSKFSLTRVDWLDRESGHRRIYFQSIGSHHQTLYIPKGRSGVRRAELVGWSIHRPISESGRKEKLGHPYSDDDDRTEYFVFFASGLPMTDDGVPIGPNERVWDFWVELKNSPGAPAGTLDPIHLAVASQYLDDSSPILDSIIAKLPNWITPVQWVSSIHTVEI